MGAQVAHADVLHPSLNGVERDSAVWVQRLLMAAVVAAWPLAAASRFIGRQFGAKILLEALPTDLIALVCVAGALFFALQDRRKEGLTAIGLVIALMAILGAHLLFGAPEEAGAWNTRIEEFGRAALLLAIPATCLALSNGRTNEPLAVATLYAIVISGVFCGVLAVLQAVHVLPNVYFQWYGAVRLGRPAGGFEHPHYFAATCVIAACAAIWLTRIKRLGAYKASAIVTFMGLCVVLSTSRVGLIFTIVAAGCCLWWLLKRYPKLFVIGVPLGLLLIGGIGLYFATVGLPDTLAGYGEVFSSAFNRADGDILRGRQVRWAHELELISQAPWFGYGYQPYVSHNLVLRQLQVSGVFGSIAYFMLLGLWVRRSLTSAVQDKVLVLAAWVPVLIGALTFPILVSVPLSLALAAFGLCASTQPSQR